MGLKEKLVYQSIEMSRPGTSYQTALALKLPPGIGLSVVKFT